MYQNINVYYFIDAFKAHDRIDQFGLDGLRALFTYIEDLEDDMGEPIEFDVVALCCEYQLYSSITDYNEQYGTEYHDCYEIDATVIPLRDGHGSFITSEH